MIVLASASPRRRSLLSRAGLAFEVEVARVDEDLDPGTDPELGARLLAERKARAVAELRVAAHGGGLWVIGADTIVALPDPPGADRLLGKPAGPDEARSMLRLLSGSLHRVVTGVSVVAVAASGSLGPARTASETTWVEMRPFEPDEIEAYVASEEWRDKAGGYAIQGSADRFVRALSGGGFDNVVGLPVGLTLELLRRSGVPAAELPP